MKWFPKFRKIHSGRATPSLLWASSLPEQEALAEHLRALKAHPAWRHYQALLERVAQQEYDQLGQGLGYEQYLAQCGAYQACRRSVDLVDTLIAKVDDLNGRRTDESNHKRDHRDAIFFGSPIWQSLP